MTSLTAIGIHGNVCVCTLLCAAYEDWLYVHLSTHVNDVVCNCKAAGATSTASTEGVLHQCTKVGRAVLVQYIHMVFISNYNVFNCFFYEIVISIMHIKFLSILPQHELLMDNDKSDNETSNWNQFN